MAWKPSPPADRAPCPSPAGCGARGANRAGFTLIEVVVTVAIGALLIAGLGGVVGQAFQVREVTREENDLTRQAHFALSQMARMAGHTRRLLLPLADNPATTTIAENVRDTATNGGVLAVSLPADVDLDGDGVPDADNDGDGFLDEDLPADSNNDGRPGIRAIDDDGNWITDFCLSPVGDDDESTSLTESEDPINSTDDDGDGAVDEDPPADMNGDGCPGLCGVDDDGDGTTDEGNAADDDEDGRIDEDWLDSGGFFWANNTIVQRLPVPWDTNGDGVVTGLDYVESTLADHVTRFRVERIPTTATDRALLVDLTLELTGDRGETFSLHTQVRVGGHL